MTKFTKILEVNILAVQLWCISLSPRLLESITVTELTDFISSLIYLVASNILHYDNNLQQCSVVKALKELNSVCPVSYSKQLVNLTLASIKTEMKSDLFQPGLSQLISTRLCITFTLFQHLLYKELGNIWALFCSSLLALVSYISEITKTMR